MKIEILNPSPAIAIAILESLPAEDLRGLRRLLGLKSRAKLEAIANHDRLTLILTATIGIRTDDEAPPEPIALGLECATDWEKSITVTKDPPTEPDPEAVMVRNLVSKVRQPALNS